jgi:methanogenic corrinoid protein MtbC1
MSADVTAMIEALQEAHGGHPIDEAALARGDAAATSRLIDTVLAPMQRSVGDRWERGALSTDEARVMTDVVDDALTMLWESAEQFVSPRGPKVVVVVAPGEWHGLPARMIATALRCEGCNVAYLGAPTTPTRLERYLEDERPHAVAISASMTLRLVDAAEAIDAAQRLGVAVIAGGAAFGTNAARARALGANAWCADAASAAHTLRTWEHEPPRISGRASAARAVANVSMRAAIVDAALRTLQRADRGDHTTPPGSPDLRLAGADLAGLLAFTEAALLTDDDSVLTDAMAWWRRRLDAIDGDPHHLVWAIDSLVGELVPGPRRALLLRARPAAESRSTKLGFGGDFTLPE